VRIVAFEKSDGLHLGVVRADSVIDIAAILPGLPRDLKMLLQDHPSALSEIDRAITKSQLSAAVPIASLKLATPIAVPGKMICLGLNYVDHVAESKHGRQGQPTLFMRASTSLVPHGEDIIRPSVSEQLDYEAELAVIVGKRMRHVSPEQALEGVAGYACFNDGSVRDYQRHTVQWTMGKNFDRTGGFGPIFVTADELPRGAVGLKIETRVNGETLQSNNTSNMIFNVADSLSYVSEGMTLEPGDVIAMGTPSGVGHARTPQKWLRHGDVVEVEIAQIGVLRNTVRDEQFEVCADTA
jgi:acylpyruvate hydrolase